MIFKALKQAIQSYIQTESAFNRLQCLTKNNRSYTKKEVYKLATIAALYGHTPDDFDQLFNKDKDARNTSIFK